MTEFRCPKCGHKLQYRKKRNGWVCRNWKCPNYVKMSFGKVVWTEENSPPPVSYKVGLVIPVTYLFELITGEIIKVSNTTATIRYTHNGKRHTRTVSFTELIHMQQWHDGEKNDPESYYNRVVAKKNAEESL